MPTETTSSPVARQPVRDILQADKGTVVHQILAEQQGRSARLALNGDCLLGLLGTGVVFNGNPFNGLDHPKIAGKAFASGRTPFVAVAVMRLASVRNRVLKRSS